MSHKIKDTVLFLTSYPPRECGIATFTQDMVQALIQQFGTAYDFKICALEENNKHSRVYPDEVVATLNTSSLKGLCRPSRAGQQRCEHSDGMHSARIRFVWRRTRRPCAGLCLFTQQAAGPYLAHGFARSGPSFAPTDAQHCP